MFKKEHRKGSNNPVFVIFRLLLSLTMFAVLLAGIYGAYKHFSGLDPLKLDPSAVLKNIFQVKTPQQFLGVLSSIKTNQLLPDQQKKILGETEKVSNPSVSGITKSPSFRFLLIADSHKDNIDLQKAISQAKLMHPDLPFIIGLGDYSDVGTVQELNNAKKELDSSGLRYFLIPGDHDLWDSRNRSLKATANFVQVFGPTYQSFTYQNYRFLLLDNSDDYLGFSETQLNWITDELEKARIDSIKGIFVFVHEPLFHPSSDHVMGKVEKDLKRQARNLIFQLKGAGVKKIFAGDTHYFSEYSQPETNLSMVTVGAATIERNPQAPRFAIVTVYEDGSLSIEDTQIK